MNNAPKLESRNIILRQPIREDIGERQKLGLNKECVTMCGGNTSNFGVFTLEDAIKWHERLIQHPCKWIIEYEGKCIGTVGLRPYIEDNKAKFAIEIYDSNFMARLGTTSLHRCKHIRGYSFREGSGTSESGMLSERSAQEIASKIQFKRPVA